MIILKKDLSLSFKIERHSKEDCESYTIKAFNCLTGEEVEVGVESFIIEEGEYYYTVSNWYFPIDGLYEFKLYADSLLVETGLIYYGDISAQPSIDAEIENKVYVYEN